MPNNVKIATCCYCGTRAALVLRGDTRHELSCAGCGAPLHDLKMLRADHTSERRKHRMPSRRSGQPAMRRKPAKRKRRKSSARWLLEEAFDLVEDLLD